MRPRACAVLALDNERLKADLRARIEELRASRTRIVEAASRRVGASSETCNRWPLV
jgi:hypothetical protein